MANKPRYKAEQVANAITEAKGFLSVAADMLGCTRQTVANYIDRYPTVKQAKIEADEKMGDLVETKLLSLIQKENPAAIIFYCKTRLKDRGYVEKQEVEFFVKRELENMLDLLERQLSADVYNNILDILADKGS